LLFQREKQNLQGLNSVFVFTVPEREFLDRPTARLIKEFDQLEGKFLGFPVVAVDIENRLGGPYLS